MLPSERGERLSLIRYAVLSQQPPIYGLLYILILRRLVGALLARGSVSIGPALTDFTPSQGQVIALEECYQRLLLVEPNTIGS